MTPPIPSSRVRLRGGQEAIDPSPGDLLFGNRLSAVQMVLNLSADQWTHVALVVDPGRSRHQLRTAELGPRGCLSRTVDEFRLAYRSVGLARPAMGPACRHRVLDAARLHLDVGDVTYSWRYCMLVGGAGLARRFNVQAGRQWR
jgi:hypothetical protein